MTSQQKYLATMLIQGDHFLKVAPSKFKRKGYKLYNMDHSPVCYITPGTFKKFDHLLKKDKHGRMTLNLSLVRSERKNSFIKQLYIHKKVK